MRTYTKRVKTFVALLLVLCSIVTLIGISSFAEKKEGPLIASVKEDRDDMYVFANLYLDCPTEKIMEYFDYGDLLLVTVGSHEPIRVPLCPDYGAVSPGEYVIRAKAGKDEITLAINCGQAGVDLGVLRLAKDSSATKYEVVEGKFPLSVSMELLKKGEYADRMEISLLQKSEKREDYTDLTDEEYANFREVCGGTLRSGILFRSSSPIDPQLGRNIYADRAAKEHQIKTVINMTDAKEDVAAFEGFSDSYYSSTNVCYLKTSLAIETKTFRDNLAECLRFVLNNDGPYLVHCVYGKDRTGILCAILSGICGATIAEVEQDYLLTYTNYYAVRDGVHMPISEDQEEKCIEILIEMLNTMMNTELTEANFNSEIEAYVKKIGLAAEEIAAIRARLS